MVSLNRHPSHRQSSTETVSAKPTAQQSPLPVLLRNVSASASPNPFELHAGHCTLGAGDGVDVVVASETVSRRHVKVELVPEGVAVTDLGSKNGCFFRGQRFDKMILQPGSSFAIGSAEIVIELDRKALRDSSTQGIHQYGKLLGKSVAMQELFGMLQRLEGSRVSVLVAGASGTGKELIARALHDHSAVKDGPFVTVNCGALDRELVRSELFGHKRGSFTGANQDSLGAFQAAHGGTLFLDEVGELPLSIQPVLLRALESRRIQPVGASTDHAVNVRFICATNRTLTEEVSAGNFREDLYYRIRVVQLTAPPLRDRLEDVPLLARAFAKRQGMHLPNEFLESLGKHSWPGNVRELFNAVEAYLAIGDFPETEPSPGDDQALAGAMAQFVDPGRTYAEQKEEVLRLMTRAYLSVLMRKTGGNRSEAARISGLDRSYLGRLVTKLNADLPESKS